MSIQLSDDLIPIKRPHFELREHRIYFLVSARPYAEFDAADEALWGWIDGRATVAQIREHCPDAGTRLRRFWDLGVCELTPSRFPENRRPVLVFEPHMDDAVLSVGGLMWALRNTCEFTVVSIAGHSNFTSYYMLDREFFNVARVSALRKAESELVMRLLGGRHVILEEYDAPLRCQPGNWTLDWYRRHRRSIIAYIHHCSPENEISNWTATVERVLAMTDTPEIWLPLGVGDHADHELARNALLRALGRLRGLDSRVSLYFYQDVPHASRFPAHTNQILDAISAAGGILERQSEDITDAFDGKLRLNAIYGSQYKLSYMAPKLEEAARGASSAADGCCELRFKVNKLPGPIDPFAVYSGRAAVENLVTRLCPWYQRHRLAKRIRMLSLVDAGRWADDLQFLLDAFPQATFEVHLSATDIGEAERLLSSRIEIRAVTGRARAWLGRLVRIALARPYPTIVMTGASRQNLMPLFKTVCILSDPLSAITTNYLVQALRVIEAQAKPEWVSRQE